MNTPEKLMTAHLLRLASHEFSNHGCNDFPIKNTPENVEFVKGLMTWSGDQ